MSNGRTNICHLGIVNGRQERKILGVENCIPMDNSSV
jgi:hypothetical protein